MLLRAAALGEPRAVDRHTLTSPATAVQVVEHPPGLSEPDFPLSLMALYASSHLWSSHATILILHSSLGTLALSTSVNSLYTAGEGLKLWKSTIASLLPQPHFLLERRHGHAGIALEVRESSCQIPIGNEKPRKAEIGDAVGNWS